LRSERRRGQRPRHHDHYLRRTTSGAAGSSLGTTIKYLRRTTNAASGSGLGTSIMYLVNKNADAGNN
jgi:hypothetical protein